jgi:hypothetical protein
MYNTGLYLPYSIVVFAVVFVTGCILNLLKNHFIFQLTGIAFLFTYSIVKLSSTLQSNPDASIKELYFMSLPVFTGISACLISMVLGFWVFPRVRRRFRD